MRQAAYIVTFTVIFFSCVKDKPVPVSQPTVQLSSAKKVYIINEGNYGTGNSSVSLFDPGSNQVVEDIYRTANNEQAGDVAQSLSYINGSFYLVVNNSGKMLVCDAKFKKTAQINGLSSPRYIQQITNQKAYVSDLYSNTIHIIDLNSAARTGGIGCPGWTEKMIMIYNKVFVTNPKRSYVYLINALNDTRTDSIYVGANASGIVLDKNDKVWVLASGDQSKNALPRLSRINPINNQVETFYEFAQDASPGNLCLNKGKDTLHFLSKGIFRMAITESALPSQAFVAPGTYNFYGLGINPNDYTIYAADALDYSQRSSIYIFDAKGNKLQNFKAGINSNGFYFE